MPRRSRRSSRRSSRRTSRRASRPAAHSKPSLKSGLMRKLRAVAPGAPVTARTFRSASVKLTIGRSGGLHSEAYACAAYGGSGATRGGLVGKRSTLASECATGRNPRVAVAGALRKLASKMESRGGVFNGLGGGKRRRRRKSRR